jgi:hypothetical protein
MQGPTSKPAAGLRSSRVSCHRSSSLTPLVPLLAHNHAGRLEFVRHFFLNWEGLLLGGVFVGGLGVTAVKLYMHERVDDMRR